MIPSGPASSESIPRAVLDTSVLFSAHRHWLWLLARLHYFEGVWSTFIVNELVRVRVEHSIARGVERSVYWRRINDLIHLFSDVLLVADYRSTRLAGVLSDPDDEPILATAVAAHAGFLVTLNTRDFPKRLAVSGLHVLTPDQFREVLESRYPHDDLGGWVGGVGRTLP